MLSFFGLPPGALAVTLDRTRDLDDDGFADADNDRDGRIDEDVPADASNDQEPGLYLLDDNNDGMVDPSWMPSGDDDEGGFQNEDPIDGVDNEPDGAFDEDPPADMNGDGAPGVRTGQFAERQGRFGNLANVPVVTGIVRACQ